jgi:tetraacyldisaccharide 4'-kinase
MRFLLFPFSLLYQLVTWLRNTLYDRGYKPQAEFDLPVICVGNLSVGGTGKTPMIEYLITLFLDRYKIATLSRGYGRKTKGFRMASARDNAGTLGDEPFQFFRKYGEQIVVAVGEERAMAIPSIIDEHNVDIILLDDAFQHRRVKPSFSILLTDFNRPFFKDFVLPMGRLRESRTGVERAQVIVVTKCPTHLSEDDQLEIEKSIREYSNVPVFFSSIEYGMPLPFANTTQAIGDSVILVTGIANAKPFRDHVGQHYKILDHLEYSDHYDYSDSDIQTIRDKWSGRNDTFVLTTEKDMVKLSSSQFQPRLNAIPVYYLPIRPRFVKNGRDFDEMLLTHVAEFQEKNLAG